MDPYIILAKTEQGHEQKQKKWVEGNDPCNNQAVIKQFNQKQGERGEDQLFFE